MNGYAPITVQANDNNNNTLFQIAVPFEFEINARQLLERAFVNAQTPDNPDPFLYTIEYFGYSESSQFPGYLGYEVESIAGLPNNDSFFWDLMVNGISSQSGADTTFPNPGATVLWQYTSTTPAKLSARTSAIKNRRRARTSQALKK